MGRFYSICFTSVLVLLIAVKRRYVQGTLKRKYLVYSLYTNSEGKSMTIMAGQKRTADRPRAAIEILYVDTTVTRNGERAGWWEKDRGKGQVEGTV